MSKFSNSSEERGSGGGSGDDEDFNKCSVCHSNKRVMCCPCPSIDDKFFLFNKLFELPAEHCIKLFDQHQQAPEQSSERLSAEIQLQFCSSCKVEIERAKHIYQQLIVAVGQFRDVQKKLAEAVKARRGRYPGDEMEPKNVTTTDDRSSWTFDACTSRKAKFLHNIERNAPFIVEDLKVKLERITGTTSELAQSKLSKKKDSDVVDAASVSLTEDVSFSPNSGDAEKEYKIVDTTDESSQMESENGNNSEDEETVESEEEKVLEATEAQQQSETVIKQEYDSEEESMWSNDEGQMSITAEGDSENSENDTCPQEFVNSEPLPGDDKLESPHLNKPGFHCSKCQHHCSTQHGLSIHKARMHGIMASRKNEKTSSEKTLKTNKKYRYNYKGRFKCPEKNCGKSFRAPYLLREHATKHSKQPMHKCQWCGDVYYHKASLLYHERSRHSQRDDQVENVCTDTEARKSSTSANHNTGNNTCPQEQDNSEAPTKKWDGESSFQCSKCSMSCPTENGLRIHMALKHKVYDPNRRLKKKGLNFQPSKEGRYKCPDCEKSFSRSNQFKVHISRHNKAPMFKCQLCEEKMFYTRGSLRRHQQKLHPELATPEPEHAVASAKFRAKLESYECNLCAKEFKTNSAFAIHKKRVHGIVEPLERTCPEKGCSIVFKSNSIKKLREHLSRCHGWEPTYKCSKCDQAFPTYKRKWRHEDQVHSNGLTTRPFICELCGQSFTCGEYLHTHRHTKHRDKSNTRKNNETQLSDSFACDLCDKTYSSDLALRTHKSKYHDEAKSVVCEICGKTYKSIGALKTHTLVAHEPDKLKEACHLCERKFIVRRHLELHLYNHHHFGPKEYGPRPKKGELYQCPVTGCRRKYYGDKCKLDKHMKKIHGEDGKKPGAFNCRFCGNSFFVRWKLQHHEMVHENKDTRPYICDICEKGFPTPYHLQFHKTSTHKLTGVKLEHERKQSGNSTATGTTSN